MNILFDNDELLRLLTNLYILTGIRANIFDFSGRDICLTGGRDPFCEKVNSCPEGHRRCVDCDARAVERSADVDGVHFYRCHAGLREAIIPIRSDGTPVAYMAFGQLLDNSPMEEQWARARAALEWYPGGPDTLREDFFRLRQYSHPELVAFAQVLQALASHIHLAGLIQVTKYDDLQRLELYLDQHFREKISLSTASESLNISRTRLCALAKRLSGGKTLSRMIAERRVAAAKLLLTKSDTSISAVAESVGIIDYNYFTKVFRSVTGMTPSAFRSQYRLEPERFQ